METKITQQPTARLREPLARPGGLIIPGGHHAMGGRMIEPADFPAAYMTGRDAAVSRRAGPTWPNRP